MRRSELSTPGHSAKMIAKAAQSEADMVFLDLEDAVAPAAKVGARRNIIAGLNELDWGRKIRSYRINGVHTQWCHDDIAEVVTGAGANIDVIMVPKIKGPREVWFVDDMLTQLELKLGLEVGRIGIECLVEEVEAIQTADEIARCSPRLEALTLGVGDLSASQGMRLGHIGVTDGEAALRYPGDVWHYARTRMIIACRAAGIDAIDGPYANIANPGGYEKSAATFSMLGGVGKWCIHPSQIEVANRVFAPSPEEIAEARGVVDAVRAAEAQGQGAANYKGMMIDAATTRLFEVTLDRARQCGLID
ncbi:MAG: CoA ester lyase [bacterium]|nr:CoA ester lyase [bacterium]MCY4273304.1 CoA ester lyase [bacterium]